MSAATPIRNLDELKSLKNYYLEIEPNLRNYLLISTGINTALRISDILALQWKEVYDFQNQTFQSHITIKEKKTGKMACVAINKNLKQAFVNYMESKDKSPQPDEYIFHGRDKSAPLSRSQAFRIISQAGSKLHLTGHISCHSLRKTFGYHAWLSGANPAVLMVIYNHSSFNITKRYLGIEQDDKDQIYMNLNL